MATILLNGVAFDTSAPTELNDKLTVSGGTDALDVNLLGGDDLIEVATQGENITSSKMDGGSGDDVITIELNGDDDDFTATSTISADSTIRGATGDDTITINDGNVIVEGLVNANDGDDTISVVRADGATIQGGAGEDEIHLGSVESLDQAGSRATNSINDTTIYSGKGDDTIRVQESAELTAGSTDGVGTGILNGGNDDDTIVIADGASIENYAVNGNKGDDVIIATGDNAYTNTTIFGGKGNDMLHVGGGVTAVGGLGADTFSIESAGGVTIEDFDKLDLVKDDQDPIDGQDDCFCDDQIQIDGHKIFHTTYTYDVDTDVYTSASSWTGDIKVKAVAAAENTGNTATAKLTATKTETLSAFAVARLFIDETKAVVATTLPEVQYPDRGQTVDGKTFINGLRDEQNAFGRTSSEAAFKAFTSEESGDQQTIAARGSGIAQAFASAEGYWTNISVTGGFINAKGAIRGVVAQTTTKYEKGDFSFLQLTATEKIGVTTNQKLVFNDITQATIKNHYAEYQKVKETDSANLYDMNFGTANFKEITTGKAYMVLTELEDKTFKTTTLDITGAQATAKVTLTLNDHFEAWVKVNDTDIATGTVKVTDDGETVSQWNKIKFTGVGTKEVPLIVPTNTTDGAANTTITDVQRFITADGKFGYGTGTEAKTLGGKVITGNVTTTGGNFVRYTGTGTEKSISKGTLLTASQAYWQTLQLRGLLTLTTTAVNPANLVDLGSVKNSTPITGATFGRFGTNNTNRTKDDYVTGSGKLIVKIKVSDEATAKATKALDTIVERTTIFGTELPVSTCPPFPTMAGIADRLVDGQAKQGDITGDFNTKFVWANSSNNLRGNVTTTTKVVVDGVTTATNINRVIPGTTGEIITTTDCSSDSTCVRNTHRIANFSNTDLGINGETFTKLNNGGTNGFFSAAAFTVDALVAENFGEFATVRADDTDAKNLPFKVLFFDNDEADNGLYVISGTANYNNGALTAINTAPTASSAMGGKHTIVKVTGEKGHPIELSDINLV